MDQNSPSRWNNPPTSEFRPIQQDGQGARRQKQSMSPALAVVLTLMVVLIVGLVALVAFLVVPRLSGTSAAPVTSTVSATATAENPAASAQSQVQPAQPAQPVSPSGSYVCSNAGGGPLSRSAVGSSVTSCEFAASVRGSYLANGGNGGAMVIDAYSPVTGTNYTMSCSGGAVVTCSGGNNAVVYIY